MQVVLKRKLIEKSVNESIDFYKKTNHLKCLCFEFFFRFLSLLFALKCVFVLVHKHVIES